MAQNFNQGNIDLLDEWRAEGNTGDLPVGWNGSGGGGSGGDQAAALQKQLVDAYNKQNDAYSKGLKDYETNNPFAFDDMLKQETDKATTNISPVYTQLLGNYLKGVSFLKGNTVVDEQRALTKLQADYDAYTGQSKALLKTTMRQVGQNYGNAGSYDAGARARAQGESTADTAYALGQKARDFNYQEGTTKLTADRALDQTIPLAQTEQEQSWANQERSDIYNQAQQLANYDQSKYNYNKQQFAVSQVPSVSVNGVTTQGSTIPGLSQAQTQAQLTGLLPNVTVSNYGGATPAPILGYGA